jgi:CRP-like cAMP-binding protein
MIVIIMLPEPFDILPASSLRRTRVAKGQSIFRQNDVSLGPLFLIDGEVQLIRHTENGNRVVLHRAHANETFAEASLFSDSYHCDALVLRDAELFEIDKSTLLGILGSNPDFALAMVKHLARQIQGYRRQLELLAIKSAPDRVFAALCDHGQRGSVMSLAGEVGLTHEATYRALSDLVARNLVIRQARGRYCVA